MGIQKGRKPENPVKNPRSRNKNQYQTQPTPGRRSTLSREKVYPCEAAHKTNPHRASVNSEQGKSVPM